MEYFLKTLQTDKRLAREFREFISHMAQRVYDASHWEKHWTREHADLAKQTIMRVSLDIIREHSDNGSVIGFE